MNEGKIADKISVGMISLGCDKNRVDSERMLFSLREHGFNVVDDENEADVVIINSCAFIDSAKRETISEIMSAASLKETGKVKKIVLTGCFATRYPDTEESLPEVDLFLPIAEENRIAEKIAGLFGEKFSGYEATGRVLTTPAHYAYLKIADGCDNMCSYCAIPHIRGRYVSYPVETLVNEAKTLSENGVRELILVAQDVTNYGKDLFGKPSLVLLLKELVKLDFWKIRILYAYPELISEELLQFIAENPKMAKYLDVPMQHSDPRILKLMNRRNTEPVANLVARIRNRLPDATIRSTFICGFPGEDDEAHENLLEFLKNGVDFGGFFLYSPEEGTPAFSRPRISARLAKKYLRECESVQSQFTAERQKRFVGQTLDVIYEGVDYKKQLFYGRSEYNAPEVDTLVYFTSDFPVEVGRVVRVKIEKSDFNLYGATVKEEI